MRRLALVLVVAALVAPAAAAAPVTGGDPQAIERLVVPCRAAARASMRGDRSVGDRYLAALLRDSRHKQAEIVACGAYLTAIDDVFEGRIVPVDPN